MRLSVAALVHIFCGKYAATQPLLDELVALADEKAPYMKSWESMYQGYRSQLTGKASDAVQMLTSGITALASTGATLWMPLLVAFLASSHASLGQFDDAWRCLNEAMTAIEATKEGWFEAEVHRMAEKSR